MIGTVVHGKYEIRALLGKGGMGAVYEAIHNGTHRRVALKVILAAANKEMVARFQREARAAGAIDTQHIVQVLDSGVDPGPGTPYMVMELLRGGDLAELVERVGPLPPDLAIRIAAQACAGLARAHRAGVTHRDIKPANLHLSEREDGEIVVKLLDFGVAKIRSDVAALGTEEVGLTRTGNMLGSPLYMSPEQAMGLKTIDHRSDIWSMGVVLYEMLAGKAPYADLPTLGLLIVALGSKDPAPLQTVAPWVPAGVAQVVHTALARDVEARFQSVDDLAGALQGLAPEGLSIRKEMLRGLTPAERAQAAPSPAPGPLRVGDRSPAIDIGMDRTGVAEAETPGLDSGRGGEDAPRSDEGALADTAVASEQGAPGGERGHLALTPRAEASLAPPPLAGPRGGGALAPRPRASRALGIAAVAALGVGGILVLRPRPTEAPPAAPPAATALVAGASGGVPTVVPAAPLAPDVSGMLAVDPPEATCEVDGAMAAVTSGRVEIRGRPGSIHHVSVRRGQAVVEGDVVLTEAGPRPARMALAAAGPSGASSAAPGGKPRPGGKPAPRGDGSAVPPASPAPAGDPHMDTKFP